MRDAHILAMQQANAQRSMLLLKQFEFLETRMAAYEQVLDTPWNRIKAILWPGWLKTCVDAAQQVLLQQRKEALRKAAQKPKLVVPK